MDRYQPTTPRTAFAVAAVALTAITIGVMVILPTKMDGVDTATTLARGATATVTPATTAVATRFGRIDVVATREREVAMTHAAGARSKL